MVGFLDFSTSVPSRVQTEQGRAPEAKANPITRHILVEMVRYIQQSRWHSGSMGEAILVKGRRKVSLSNFEWRSLIQTKGWQVQQRATVVQ